MFSWKIVSVTRNFNKYLQGKPLLATFDKSSPGYFIYFYGISFSWKILCFLVKYTVAKRFVLLKIGCVLTEKLSSWIFICVLFTSKPLEKFACVLEITLKSCKKNIFIKIATTSSLLAEIKTFL